MFKTVLFKSLKEIFLITRNYNAKIATNLLCSNARIMKECLFRKKWHIKEISWFWAQVKKKIYCRFLVVGWKLGKCIFFRLDSECTLGFNNICRLLYHHPIEVQESQQEAIFRWSNFTKRSSEVAWGPWGQGWSGLKCFLFFRIKYSSTELNESNL